MYVHGNARHTGEESLTITNVNFTTTEADHDFISSNTTESHERYAHNVTVKNSTFTATDEAEKTATGLRIRQGFDITIENVEASGLASLMWTTGTAGVKVADAKVIGKNGISVGTSTGVELTNVTITAEGYGFRADGSGKYDATITGGSINAVQPVVIRKVTGEDSSYTLTVSSTTLTATEGGYQVIFTENSDDDELAAPTGKFTYTVDEGVTVYPTSAYVAKVGEQGFLTLAEAVAAANAIEGGATIELLDDVTLGEKLIVTGNVTITGAYTITRDAAYTGTLFTVNAGATLTLDGGLIIDGNNNWTLNEELYNKALKREVEGVTWAALITSEEGKPDATAPMFKVTGSVVANNVTIQNNYSSKSSNNGDYGVFQVDANATLTMSGATVKHIVTGGANSVAHLSTNSVWTINDGTLITDTFASKNGGVCRNDSGVLVMNGGEVSNNKSLNTNGTFVMLYKGSM